jgi:hypothetical protein
MLLFLFGAVIIAVLKVVLVVVLIGAGIALACFLLYWLGRKMWEKATDVTAYLPKIDWTLPPIPSFDARWLDIRYPGFPAPGEVAASHIFGTSGAWKEVMTNADRFPSLRSAAGPQDLQRRVSACEAAAPDILRGALAKADEIVRLKQADLQQQLQRLREAEGALVGRVQPQLDTAECWVEAMSPGSILDQFRARWMRSCLSEYKNELARLRQEVRERARRQEQAICNFLDPSQRERTCRERIQQDITDMKAVVTSKEFAGAVAEVAVIAELAHLNNGSLIFNDVSVEAERYIHFGGKPLQRAQIDTLAITTAGVFVVEVKNWSREFADSGEGFSPYEQVSRASYLVFDHLRRAGMKVRVRSIIATNGSLPEKGDQKVAVVPINRLRRYIEGAPDRQVDVSEVRLALRL